MPELCDFITFLLAYRELDFIIAFFKLNLFLLFLSCILYSNDRFFPPLNYLRFFLPFFPPLHWFICFEIALYHWLALYSLCSWAWPLARDPLWLHPPMLGLQEDRVWSYDTELARVCDSPVPASLVLELQACAVPIIF